MKICLHNKKDKIPCTNMPLSGQVDCYECTYDPENNKNCRLFYPIEVLATEIIENDIIVALNSILEDAECGIRALNAGDKAITKGCFERTIKICNLVKG